LLEGDRRIDAHAAHLLGLLGRSRVEYALLQGSEGRRVAVEAGDPDMLVGMRHLDRLSRAKRERVGLAEDQAGIWMGLQQVLGQGEALILVPLLAPKLADDLDIRVVRKRFAATLGAIDLWRRALLTVDDQHLTLSAGEFRQMIANLLGGIDAVGGDERVARRAVGVAERVRC